MCAAVSPQHVHAVDVIQSYKRCHQASASAALGSDFRILIHGVCHVKRVTKALSYPDTELLTQQTIFLALARTLWFARDNKIA